MAEDQEAGNWQELLAHNPLFDYLRNSTSKKEGKRNVMCEIRGDLFFWMSSDKTRSLLTTNLKKMVAFPTRELVFQELKCTHVPDSGLVNLLPHSSGQYIALQCECDMTVITLPWHRGEFGEFGGGTREVSCSGVQIAKEFFAIHRDSSTPPLIQASWHPTAPFHLALLTMDSSLRLYNIADPDYEVLSLALPSSPMTALSMKDPVVAFSLWEDKAFLLQEDSEVTLTPLTHHTRPPDPLPVHPQMDSDGGSDAVAMLVLPSNPCVVVIATTSGTLSHCVYLSDSDKEDLQEEPAPCKGCLYVVDSISFNIGESESGLESPDESAHKNMPFVSSLISDPLYSHIYYVVHSEGMHQVTLPWLSDLEQYTSSETASPVPLHCLPKEKEAHERLLFQTEPGVHWLEGVAIVSEPMLGLTVLGLTSDWSCLALPLEQSKPAPPLAGTLPSPRRLKSAPRQSGIQFAEVISKILGDGSYLTSHEANPKFTQQQCYKYLSDEIKRLREQHLLKQKKAKEKMKQKILSLEEQNQRIVSEKVRVEDEIDEIISENEKLKEKAYEVQEQCKELGQRASTLLCKMEAQSPVLSQAEQWMRDEVDGLNSHMPLLLRKLQEGERKLELCCGGGHTPKVNVNVQQSKTILRSLTENGKSLKKLMDQIQGLRDAVNGPSDS